MSIGRDAKAVTQDGDWITVRGVNGSVSIRSGAINAVRSKNGDTEIHVEGCGVFHAGESVYAELMPFLSPTLAFQPATRSSPLDIFAPRGVQGTVAFDLRSDDALARARAPPLRTFEHE